MVILKIINTIKQILRPTKDLEYITRKFNEFTGSYTKY